MISQQLKAATTTLHTRLDSHPLLTRLMTPSVTTSDFQAVLVAFGGFIPQMEMLLLPFAPDFANFGLEFNHRRKSSFLKNDLSLLQIDSSSLPICTALPNVATLAEAFGCLYVLEGATLGGQVIAQHLARSLNIRGGEASYFSSYGSEVGMMWREFRSVISNYANQCAPEGTPARLALLDSASATFSSLIQWLETCETSRKAKQAGTFLLSTRR